MSGKRLKQKTVANKKPPSNGRPRYYSAMSLSKLKPYKANPRQNEEAVEAVVKSLEQFGKIAPIIVNEKLRICAGHTRFKAALERGDKTFPTLIVPGLTGERFKAYNIADNQTASIAQWDTQGLAEIIRELQEGGFPTETLGFAEDQLDEILASLEDDSRGLTDPDDVPEPPKKAISKTGDLWLCGDHRLLCGDATVKNELLNGFEYDSVITDPPYGINYQPLRNSVRQIANDETSESARAVTVGALHILEVKTITAWYLFCDWRSLSTMIEIMGQLKIDPKACIVWDKMHGVQNLDRYHKQHEFILYSGEYGGVRHECGDVWSHERDYNHKHPTVKPVGLIAKAIETGNCRRIYDPFLGSGTTMIAAEKLGRKCMGMEIEPIYVDVAVRRWQNFTGKKAVLIRKGKTTKIMLPDVQEVVV